MEVRIRLRFNSTPLHYAKKCCFLFNRDSCRTVRDLAYLIAARFDLETSGIQLFLEDFLIPSNESSAIIRDSDIIEVRTVDEDIEGTPYKAIVEATNDSDYTVDKSLVKKAKRRKKEVKLNKQKTISPPPADHKVQSDKDKKKVKCTTKVPAKKLTEDTISNKTEKGSKVEEASNEPAGVLSTTADTSSAVQAAMKKPGVLKSVTRKSATGGVHLTFHSSSSSSNSSNEISNSSDDSDTGGSKINAQSDLVSGNLPQKPQTPNSMSVSDESSASRRGKGRGRRGGRGRGRVIGGKSDVFTTKSVVYMSPGERGRGRGRGSGWGVKKGATPDKDTNMADKSDAILSKEDNSIWVTSKAGFTKDHNSSPKQQEEVKAVESSVATGDGGEKSTAQCRDYSSLPALLGAPRIGDKIAFKVLEISSNCTPEVTDYKEAEVMDYDAVSSCVTVKYTVTQQQSYPEDSTSGSQKSSSLLRCVMTEDDEEEEMNEGSHDNHVTLNLGSLLQPKLIS